jgi:MFS family permease
MTLGTLLTYFLSIKFGDFKFSYYYVALFAAGFVALFEILMLMTYETPRWLFSKDSDYTGIRVLKIIRGPKFEISKEIDSIKAVLRHTYSTREQLLEFRKRTVLHPFILVLFLMFFQQFSGINTAIFYASQIFSNVGYNQEKANLVSFGAVGCVQVVATLMSVVLVDYLGRRVLLISSSACMVFASILLAVYFYVFDDVCHGKLTNADCPASIESLAIVGIIIYIIGFSLGWGPIPWSSMSELLPNHVRTLGGSIATFTNWGFATIIIFVFPLYSNLVHMKFTWLTFAIIMIVSIVFVVLFIPEAKGRSLEEIQEVFERGDILACSCRSKSKRWSFSSSKSKPSSIN